MNPVKQPASKYESVFDALNTFRETGNFTPFDLKRLKKDANQVKDNVNLANGFELLGMIAFYEDDLEEMKSCHKRAIEQSGYDARYIANYVKSLVSSNLFDEAYKYALKAYERDPLHLSSLDAIISISCIFNEKDNFERYIKEWEKINRSNHYLTFFPLYLINDSKKYYEFIRNNPNLLEIRNLFNPGLIQFFATPLNIILEVMPEPGHEDELVAWIQWYGDINDGMERYSAFEKWFIENEYDLKSNVLHFNIEMVGE